MIAARPIYRMAQLTLQAASAHGVHSGQGDNTHDVLLVRDANGLPALPGTSLAGVLRHDFTSEHGEVAAARLFGQAGDDAQASWLTIAWGLVHNSHNKPVAEGLVDVQGDELLARLVDDKPIVRQRVRLNHRGAAKDNGKFDQTLVPAGVRYTSWLGYWCDGSEQSVSDWDSLVAQLTGRCLRIGHGTRNGAGRFEVVALLHGAWDLRTAQGRQGYLARPRSRSDHTGLQLKIGAAGSALEVVLQLRAESGWRVGGGERSLYSHVKMPDLLPQHEPAVVWQGDRGCLTERWHLLPGSALKGAIRHRLAFHYRCLNAEFAGMGMDPEPDACPAVRALLGYSDQDEGRAGILAFSDLQLGEGRAGVLMHNRIDRYTGGVIRGALFSEEVLWRTPVTLRIEVIDSQRHDSLTATMRQALQRTLEDLAAGWLPLGAGGSRGLGVFSDDTGLGPQWSDGGAWVGLNAMEASE
ncbi:RAMP superfamily CRISPR-associated protein [Halopseudomonas sp.]|jgi:CRISPR/Cas system CMR subunit Cmr4 (Cas7 group RAMP superfamily)|uniref:RAMP superfamily CRISPR-associated protein n=1 Tax=Halopseudomonas sp. TaxID=2901191 RepID=UPI003002BA32